MPKENKQDGTTIWDILDNPAVCDGERRILIRPVIHTGWVITSVIGRLTVTGLISLFISFGVCLVARAKHGIIIEPMDIIVVCMLGSYFLLILISLKGILIFLVELYQAKASDQIRLRCVFVPSCSEYMILSLKKYGVIIGLIKGIGRLYRCRNSNGIGGEDYP